MICITGVPGTGKTTICSMLTSDNIDCKNLNDVAKEMNCMEGEDVDIDCMRKDFKYDRYEVVESHYSHNLRCDFVIILESEEDILRKRMADRGYSKNKIEENIEVQRTGSLYYEALEQLPSVRIFTINTNRSDIDMVYARIKELVTKNLNHKK